MSAAVAITGTATALAYCRKGERVQARLSSSPSSATSSSSSSSSSPSPGCPIGGGCPQSLASGYSDDSTACCCGQDPTTNIIVLPSMMSMSPHNHSRRRRRRRRPRPPSPWSSAAARCCHTCGADLTDTITATVTPTGFIRRPRCGAATTTTTTAAAAVEVEKEEDGGGGPTTTSQSSSTGERRRCFDDGFSCSTPSLRGGCHRGHRTDGRGDAVDGCSVHRDCSDDRCTESGEPIKEEDEEEGSHIILGCPLCVEGGSDGDSDIQSGDECSALNSSPLYCSEGCRLPSLLAWPHSSSCSSSPRDSSIPPPSPHAFFCGASSVQLRAVGDYLRSIGRRDEDVGCSLLATCLAFLSSSSSSSPSSKAIKGDGLNSDDGGGDEEGERGRTSGGGDEVERRRALLSDLVFGRGCATTPTSGDPSNATSRKKRKGQRSCESYNGGDDTDRSPHPGPPVAEEESKRRMSGVERTAVEECWSLLSAAILSGPGSSGSCRNQDDRGRGNDHRHAGSGSPPDLDSFIDTYVRVRREFLLPHPISVPGRLLDYLASGKLSDLPEAQLSRFLLDDGDGDGGDAPLRPFVDHAFRNDGDGDGDGTQTGDDAWADRVTPRPSRSVLLQRMAARVAQVAADPSADADADEVVSKVEEGTRRRPGTSTSPFDAARHRFRVLCPAYSLALRHSCVPNCAVEGYYIEDDEDDNDEEEEEDEAEDGRGSCGNVDVVAGDVSRRHRRRSRRPGPILSPRHRPRPLRLRLVALHDLSRGEPLTVSKIDHENLSSPAERSAALGEKLLLAKTFRCDCVRCRYERPQPDGEACDDDGRSPSGFSRVDLKRLGDLAMQHGRYADAVAAYGLVLARSHDADDWSPASSPSSSSSANDGDVLHARAAALLHMGRHGEARDAWEEAHRLCRGSHDGIALQVKKREAYGDIFGITSPVKTAKSPTADVRDDITNGGIGTNGKRKRPPETQEEERGIANGCNMIVKDLPPYRSLLGRAGKCFVTAPGHPLLSAEECARAIHRAEEHASSSKNGGWTTSRHYAVPTTDIPVHEIPPLLFWFRSLLRHRLSPLLAEQFGAAEVGTNGSRIAVHDAFVVRYDAAAGQRHLPMHRDESTHSFTIALNDPSEYDGGGTYVAELGRSVFPERGGVLSFRGDEVLHGGDPVVRGVRYILVAFCYVSDDVSTDGRNARVAPNATVDKFFRTRDQSCEGSFAFGFEV